MRALIVCCGLLVACSSSPKRTDKPGRVVVSDTPIEFLDPITFVGDTAELAPTSSRLLDSVATTMTGDPSIELEVVVHSADKTLSAQRAKVIVEQLIARNVAADRLRASAGDDSPVRTEFVITRAN